MAWNRNHGNVNQNSNWGGVSNMIIEVFLTVITIFTIPLRGILEAWTS